MRVLVVALLYGCTPEADDAPRRCPEPAGAQLVVTTTDYRVGALATVDLQTGCVADRLSSRLGGDPIAVHTGGFVAVVLRSDGDVIRLYEPGSFEEPVREIAVDPGSIIHDVAIVGDRLFATPYERAEIDVYDLIDERWLTPIDVSDYADRDGIPEVDRFTESADGLLVALQRLDRDDGWTGDHGSILTLDPHTLTVAAERVVGPNPKLFGDRVLSGIYGVLDGALSSLDGEVFLTEADEGFDFALYGARNGRQILVGSTLDGESRIRCFDGSWQDGESLDSWVSDLVMTADGTAILATRTGWHSDASAGLETLDIQTCSWAGNRIDLTLEPYSLALVE